MHSSDEVRIIISVANFY